jgi:hypothetical protein
MTAIFLKIMQIASPLMTDGLPSSPRHLGKQISYNMKFFVSKGERQQKQGNKRKPS